MVGSQRLELGELQLSGSREGGPRVRKARAQQLIVNAQYIKDLSFENPRAPQSLIQQTTQRVLQLDIEGAGTEAARIPKRFGLNPIRDIQVPWVTRFSHAMGSSEQKVSEREKGRVQNS